MPWRRRLHAEVHAVLAGIPADFGGGCSFSKAFLMAWLIGRFRLPTSIDIGVYRGRSLFPQAVAHRLRTAGVVYGVDPWDPEEARETGNAALGTELQRFADETDFEQIHRSVAALCAEGRYADHCVLVRQPSAKAIDRFLSGGVSFGLIHIDGNHDAPKVSLDMDLYLPRLAPGGFLVLDDVSWDSVRAARRQAEQTLALVYQRSDPPLDDYAIFWKTHRRWRVRALRWQLRLLRAWSLRAAP